MQILIIQVKASKFATYSNKFTVRTCNNMTKTNLNHYFYIARTARHSEKSQWKCNHACAAQNYLDLHNLCKVVTNYKMLQNK